MEDFKLSRCFSILHRRSQQFIVTECSSLDLSYPECILLLAVFEEEARSQDELAELLFLDKAVVTRTITMLEQKNFITRRHDNKDRRIKRIFLTEEARRHEKFLRDVFHKWIYYLFMGIEDTDSKTVENGIFALSDRAKSCTIR